MDKDVRAILDSSSEQTSLDSHVYEHTIGSHSFADALPPPPKTPEPQLQGALAGQRFVARWQPEVVNDAYHVQQRTQNIGMIDLHLPARSASPPLRHSYVGDAYDELVDEAYRTQCAQPRPKHALDLHPPARSATPPSRHSYVADEDVDEDEADAELYEPQPRYDYERTRNGPILNKKADLELYIHQLTLKDIRLRNQLTRSLPREIERYSVRQRDQC